MDKVAILLIKKGYGSQINRGDKWGDTPIHEAASRGLLHSKWMEKLPNNCIRSKQNRTNQFNSIEIKCWHFSGSEKVMEIFIKNGGNMDKPNVYGKTALHWAADKGDSFIFHIETIT